jgi:hypothetical protein
MVQVREKSRFGFCYALGVLIGETPTRDTYRNRAGTAFVSKSPRSISRRARCARTMTSGGRGLKTIRR